MGTEDNQPTSVNSSLFHYPSRSNPVNVVSKIPAFWNEDFSMMISSSGLQDCQLNHIDNDGAWTDKAFLNGQHSQEDCQNLEEVAIGASPNAKKRRSLESHSLSIAIKSVEGGNPILECSKEQDKKKHKTEQNDSASLRSKQVSQRVNDNTSSGEPQKENYVHVRAKRGQATNSHSLAERVRREKISERMRLLQELVPGCNKITGKAVMLDEIINYVQSLQQQVEFLSMKLATVNPELNLDVEQILSKDILLPGLNFSHRSFTCIPGTTPLHALPQNVWDNDLQSILQKGFDSMSNRGPNDR